MLNYFKTTNKIFPCNQKIKVFLNDGNCTKCEKKDMLIINENGSGFCERCKFNSVIFKFMTPEEHENIKENIKITEFQKFISKSNTMSSFI